MADISKVSIPNVQNPYDIKDAKSQAALVPVINKGAKNKLKNTATSQTVGEVVFTVNADGTVTAYTTATTTASRSLLIASSGAVNATDICTGTPDVEYDINTQFGIGASGGIKNISQGDAVTAGVTGEIRYFSIFIRANVNIPQEKAITFKPMICTASEYAISPEYEPYALPNPTLTPAVIKAVDNGGKNLFDYDVLGPNLSNIGTSVVVNGVRFTMNSDKSVTITRESSSSQDSYVWFRHSDGSAIIVTNLCDDEHMFSGATGASASTYRLFINNINGSGTYKYFGDGEVIGTPQVTPNAAGIFIAASHSPSNLVIKPMICTAADYVISPTFQPYALPNPTLTPAAIKAVDEGAKNLLNMDKVGASGSYSTNFLTNGVRFTVNADGTITANRESSSSSNATVALVLGTSAVDVKSLCDGAHVLSGCPSGGSSSTYRLYAAKGNYAKYDTGSGVILDDTTETTVPVLITVYRGYSASNLVFKPMICTAADYVISPTFQPYALPNPTLTPAAIKAVDEGAKNLIYPNSASGTAIDVFNIQKHIKSGSYHLYFTANNYSGKYQLNFYDIDDQYISGGLNGDIARIKSVDFALIKDAYRVKFTIVGTADIANLMLCTSADWAVSQKFVPYAPTNRELYEMIQALQNNS